MSSGACMIWSPRGCWLQVVDGGGRESHSFCGLLDTKENVRAWCRAHDLEFVDHDPGRGVYDRGAERLAA